MRLRAVSLVLVASLMSVLSGCAGLMMNVKDLDEQHQTVVLAPGESVAIDRESLEKSFASVAKEADSKDLAAKLVTELGKQLEEKGVSVDPNASQKLNVEITRFKPGSGFARGFFPFFGLGDSFLDGKVELVADEGTRVLVVEKTGQKSGTSQMGDQTQENIGYFATVVASRLVEKAQAQAEGGEVED